MINKEQSYISVKELDSVQENLNFLIKYSFNNNATELLKSTKTLTRDTDKYTNFVSTNKIKKNPNLLSNSFNNNILPGMIFIFYFKSNK